MTDSVPKRLHFYFRKDRLLPNAEAAVSLFLFQQIRPVDSFACDDPLCIVFQDILRVLDSDFAVLVDICRIPLLGGKRGASWASSAPTCPSPLTSPVMYEVYGFLVVVVTGAVGAGAVVTGLAVDAAAFVVTAGFAVAEAVVTAVFVVDAGFAVTADTVVTAGLVVTGTVTVVTAAFVVVTGAFVVTGAVVAVTVLVVVTAGTVVTAGAVVAGGNEPRDSNSSSFSSAYACAEEFS